MMDIKHLVLHVGVPKTGTSLLQRSLLEIRPQLRRRGIAYVERWQMYRLKHRKSWGAYATGPAAGKSAFAAELRRVVKYEMLRAGGRPRTVLLSNESMIGRVWPNFGDPYWPRAADGVGEVIGALAPKRTEVVIYVRRQDRLLESMYMQQIHLGRKLQWDRFIENAGRDDRIRYRDLLEVVANVPTVENIRIRPFEIIGGGAVPFVADFLADFGVEDLISFITNFDRNNASYTQPALEAALQVNPHLRTQEERRNMMEFLKEMFPPEDYPKAALLTKQERRRILEIYNSANQALFRDYLPGYPVDSYLSQKATRRLGATLEPLDVAPVSDNRRKLRNRR